MSIGYLDHMICIYLCLIDISLFQYVHATYVDFVQSESLYIRISGMTVPTIRFTKQWIGSVLRFLSYNRSGSGIWFQWKGNCIALEVPIYVCMIVRGVCISCVFSQLEYHRSMILFDHVPPERKGKEHYVWIISRLNDLLRDPCICKPSEMKRQIVPRRHIFCCNSNSRWLSHSMRQARLWKPLQNRPIRSNCLQAWLLTLWVVSLILRNSRCIECLYDGMQWAYQMGVESEGWGSAQQWEPKVTTNPFTFLLMSLFFFYSLIMPKWETHHAVGFLLKTTISSITYVHSMNISMLFLRLLVTDLKKRINPPNPGLLWVWI